MSRFVIQDTADGSKTLFVPQLDEHYHSVKGALTESQHIFIRMGFLHSQLSTLHVLDVGFGTGLNAFLTLLEAEKTHRKTYYTALELNPLPVDTIREMNYAQIVAADRADDYLNLHLAPWDRPVALHPCFTLEKMKADYTRWQPTSGYDLIYVDAFAPEKQPEMWSQELFDKLYHSMNPQGILVTYCAKGVVRRMLQASGFNVERLPGPPGGKREILRGTKLPQD